MKKKTLLAVLVSLALCMTTVTPAWAASASNGDSLTGASISTQDTQTQAKKSGGWTINKKTGSYVTKAQKKLFNKATKGLDGVTYKPIFVMSTQVVAGTNYAFFCQAKTVTAKPKTSWKVVIIFKSTDGNASVLAINSFNYKKISTLDNPPEDSKYCNAGGWQTYSKKYKSKGIPSAASKAFKKAKANYTGVNLTPLVLLSTQTVAGKNYRYLCRGVIPGSKTMNLYVVDVYKDLKGNAKITSCNPLNTSEYLAR